MPRALKAFVSNAELCSALEQFTRRVSGSELRGKTTIQPFLEKALEQAVKYGTKKQRKKARVYF